MVRSYLQCPCSRCLASGGGNRGIDFQSRLFGDIRPSPSYAYRPSSAVAACDVGCGSSRPVSRIDVGVVSLPRIDGIGVYPALASSVFVPAPISIEVQRLLDEDLYYPKMLPEGQDRYGRPTRCRPGYHVCVSARIQLISTHPPHGNPHVSVDDRDWLLERGVNAVEDGPGTL